MQGKRDREGLRFGPVMLEFKESRGTIYRKSPSVSNLNIKIMRLGFYFFFFKFVLAK